VSERVLPGTAASLRRGKRAGNSPWWSPAGKGEPAIGVSAPVEASNLKSLIFAPPSLAT